MANYEIENAISTWNEFKDAERSSIILPLCDKPRKTITTTTTGTIMELVDLGLPSGTLWTDRNVGALAQEESGDYFRFGETTPFNEVSPAYVCDEISGLIAGTERDAATVNLGKGYLMPSSEQIKELLECCDWKWSIQNRIKGMRVKGPNGNTIIFPASGYRSDGIRALSLVGSFGGCWSATPNDDINGRALGFSSKCNYLYNDGRTVGNPVRAVYVNTIHK